MTGMEEKEMEVVGFPRPFGSFPESCAGQRVRGQEVASHLGLVSVTRDDVVNL